MSNEIPAFVFRYRKFAPIITFIVAVVLKFHLHGTASLRLLLMGLAIVVLGMAFRIYSAGYLLGRHIVTEVESDFLCTSGPFAYTRNPLYLGNFVVGIGLCVALNEWYAYAIFLIEYICLYSILIPHEERFLQRNFGNAYLEYKSHTGRFLPRRKGFRGGANVRPNYRLGAANETRYLIILLIAFLLFYLLFVT